MRRKHIASDRRKVVEAQAPPQFQTSKVGSGGGNYTLALREFGSAITKRLASFSLLASGGIARSLAAGCRCARCRRAVGGAGALLSLEPSIRLPRSA